MTMIRRTIVIPAGQSRYINLSGRSWGTPLGLCIRPGAGGTIAMETSMARFDFANPNLPTQAPISPNDFGDDFDDTTTPAEDSPYSGVTEIFRAGQCTVIKLAAAVSEGRVDIMA